MMYEVEAELDNGRIINVEVMACDQYEAQVQAVQLITQILQDEKERPDNVLSYQAGAEATADTAGQVEPERQCAAVSNVR
jgi:uncharacterized protein (DUF2384 family)